MQVQYAFLAGLGLVLLLIPVNRWLASRIQAASVEMMTAKDRWATQSTSQSRWQEHEWIPHGRNVVSGLQQTESWGNATGMLRSGREGGGSNSEGGKYPEMQ
jgi:hypothetical protein